MSDEKKHESQADKLKTLLERKAQREEKKDAEAEGRLVEELELEEKLEKDLGPRGAAFEVLRTIEGPIAVKLGTEGAFKKLRAITDVGRTPNLEELAAFVLPCVVHPDRTRFLDIASRRSALYVALGDVLLELHRGKERDVQGKS